MWTSNIKYYLLFCRVSDTHDLVRYNSLVSDSATGGLVPRGL